MNDSRSPAGGGAILAGSILTGTVLGLISGETSLGVVLGIVLGTAGAIAIWLRDRGR